MTTSLGNNMNEQNRKMLTNCDGSWMDVSIDDLVYIVLSETQKKKIFPLYD